MSTASIITTTIAVGKPWKEGPVLHVIGFNVALPHLPRDMLFSTMIDRK